jgi:two-component system chemotaxis response regulator CheB
MQPMAHPKSEFPSQTEMTGCNKIVVVAASAGGVNALIRMVSDLPKDFPLPMVVVLHLDPKHISVLPQVLARNTKLRTEHVVDGAKLRPGTIFIAPPDWHVLIQKDGTLSLSHSAPVHYTRPAADRLFQSAAESCGSNSIAVVLTGMGKDGAALIEAIKNAGGVVIAQDPLTASHPEMPSAAIETKVVDYILPLNEIVPKILQLSGKERP